MQINLTHFKHNYLVAGLGDEDVKKVADLAKIESVNGGTEFVKLGAKGSDVYVVLDGIAMVYGPDGVTLGERGPGTVIGEVALVDDGPRSAYVVAKAHLTFAHFDGRELRKFMFENKEIGFIMLSNLARVMALRLREASAKVVNLEVKQMDPWKYDF
jgi:CRP-like cAMP-binding protein